MENETQMHAEKKLSDATLGKARLNTVSCPMRMTIAELTVNVGPLEEDRTRALEKSFEREGVHAWRYPMHVLVKREWVEEAKLVREITVSWAEYPSDVWTAKADGAVLHILDGNHRRAAQRGRAADLEEQIERLKGQVAQLEAAKGTSESLEEPIAQLQAQIERAEENLKDTVVWAVILLDEGHISLVPCALGLDTNDDPIICRQGGRHPSTRARAQSHVYRLCTHAGGAAQWAPWSR